MMKNKFDTQGEYMRKAREDAGLTIGDLARASGISRETISALERNVNRFGTIYTISKLADALGLSIDEYVGHEVVKHDSDEVDIGV